MSLENSITGKFNHLYSTASAMSLYGNAVMMPLETLCIGIENSADARVALTGVKFATAPLSSFLRDYLEEKLGLTKNGSRSKIGIFDRIYWLGIAGIEIGVNYFIYNKAFNADEGWNSMLPAIAGYALTANGKFIGKLLDTFKDGFSLSPCIATSFSPSLPKEAKREIVNKGCAAAYASLAAFYIYAHGPEILSSLKVFLNQ